MITDLLALLLVLAAGAVAGILITVWHAEHRRARLHADEDAFARHPQRRRVRSTPVTIGRMNSPSAVSGRSRR
jgi:hypothetical protein